jgi:hypothetical protein
LFVDASGKVGVGTASPSAPLTFAASTGRKIGFYQGTEGYSIGVENSEFRFVTDAGGVFTFKNGGTYSSAAEFARIDSSGRLGIGTSSPGDKLHVVDAGTAAGTGSLVARFMDATNAKGVFLGYDTDELGGTIYGTNFLTFQTFDGSSWGERARITPTGNVGIGTTSPQALLNISTASTAGDQNVLICGTAATGLTGSHALYLGAYGSTQYGCKIKSIYNYASNVNAQLSFEVSNAGTLTEAARIDSSGRLLVGTSTASTAGNPLLQVNGSVSKEVTSGSILNGITISLFTASTNGVYLVTTKQNDDVASRSTAHLLFTNTSGTGSRLVALATGTSWTVAMNGLTVELTNTSGVNRGYTASILQLY